MSNSTSPAQYPTSPPSPLSARRGGERQAHAQHVIVLGDAVVDVLLRLPADLSGNERLAEPELSGGGTSGNTAAALAKLGVPVAIIGTVGDDYFGRWTRDDLAAGGVNVDHLLTVEDAITTQVIAVIGTAGERQMYAVPTQGGAYTRLSPEHLPAAIETAAWLHTTGACLRISPVRAAVLKAMHRAKAAGVPVSIDLNLRTELWGWNEEIAATIHQAVACANYVFGAGQEEMQFITDADSMEAAVEQLSGDVRTVVARSGGAGAFGLQPGGQIVHAPAVAVQVVNTIGAGDAWDAGFIAAILDGKSFADALAYGNAVAAYKVAHGGARALPTREDVQRLMQN